MRKSALPFSIPEISPRNPTAKQMDRDWRVCFRYYNPATGNNELFQFKKGINYFKDFKQRLAEANALKRFLHQELKNGWNPITNEYEGSSPLDEVSDLCDMPFGEALTWALGKCEVSPTTYRNYNSSMKRIRKVSMRVEVGNKIQDFSLIKIKDIRRKHIRLLLDQCKKDLKWSADGFNKNKGYLCSVIGRFEQYDVIENNPAKNIKGLATTEKQKFVPYTEEEKRIIREYLFLHHYGFFIYLMVIFHTGIRPKEALALKVKDIDLESRLITILPDLDAENAKTKKIRKVPVMNELYLLLREWLQHDHTQDCYVFGSPFDSGRGNKGSAKGKYFGSRQPNYFKPSKTRIKRDTVTRLWNEIVMKKLKINKHLYAAKHTGADAKILAGIDLDALRELYGHGSKFMTEKYARAVKEVYRQQIMDLSPEF